MDHVPRQNIVKERGERFIIGVENRSMEDQWGISQADLPFWPRGRLILWGNHKLLMKAEYCFFYIPTLIILGIAVPAFSTIYALEEAVCSTYTVKITGRSGTGSTRCSLQ